MGIWITGDTHADVRRFSKNIFTEQREFKDDNNTVIIAGDFGLIWNYQGESKEEKYWLDWLDDKQFTTVFVDGNHENHARIANYPIKEWNGGKVHVIRDKVLHLMRGEIYTIEGKKFWVFGGASSHDIQDGILDYEDPNWKKQAKELDKEGKYYYRIKGLSWWEEELPSEEEMANGIKNLESVNWDVDFVITHSPSASIASICGFSSEQDRLTQYLEDIKHRLSFRKWFAGHLHEDRVIFDKDILVYEQIVRIG